MKVFGAITAAVLLLSLVCMISVPLILVSPALAQDCIDYGDYLHWVGGLDIPGYSWDLEISGNYCYIAANDGGLQVVDITDPENISLVNTVNTPGWSRLLAISGNLLCQSTGWDPFWGPSMRVYDITKPTDPQEIGSVALPGQAPGYVSIVGDHAFVDTDYAGLQVIDISDPTNPYITTNVLMTGWMGGHAISGNLLYVANWPSGLQVIDITDPENPTTIGSEETPCTGYGLALYGDYAYLANESSGLLVIDVSDPENPFRVNTIELPDDAYDIAISDGHAFVTADVGLCVLDLAEPTAPQITGQVETSDSAHGVGIKDSYAYIGALSGLQVVAIPSVESAPITGGIDTHRAYEAAISGNHAYVADEFGLTVIDISIPENLQIRGELETPGEARSVAISGSFAYIADGEYGLQVVDITDPENPKLTSSYDTNGQAYDVAVSGNYAYVADYNAGIKVIDIADPEHPVIVSGASTARAVGVAISDHYAYIADHYAGLKRFDIADPTHILPRGIQDTPGWALDVAILGNYAYVADNGQLLIIDVTQWDEQIDGSVGTQGYVKGVALSGYYAYVAASGAGMQVFNIVDPVNPRLVGSVDTQSALRVTISGSHAYIANGYRGLKVVPVQCDVVTAVGTDQEETPRPNSSLRVCPNPFNPHITVSFSVNHPQQVTVSVFDMTGRRVAVIADQAYSAGSHSVEWDGRDASGRAVSSGTYLVRMQTEDRVEARKVMLVR